MLWFGRSKSIVFDVLVVKTSFGVQRGPLVGPLLSEQFRESAAVLVMSSHRLKVQRPFLVDK
jgi:hypothetical protein